jgi:nucleoside-diphosphate-sugar epimerase
MAMPANILDKGTVKIGFIGLGLMGSRLTRRLHSAGWDVHAWNRSSGPADALRQEGSESKLVTLWSLDMVPPIHSTRPLWDIAGRVSQQMLKYHCFIRMEARRTALESIESIVHTGPAERATVLIGSVIGSDFRLL